MAFNDLDINQMVSLFSPYVNNPDTKKLFHTIPEIAGLYPLVVSAYEAVLSVRPPEAAGDPEIAAIATAQKSLDNRHDRLGRSVLLAGQAQRERALAEDPPNEERAAALSSALDTVFPDGGNIFVATYRAQAGNTERVERLLQSPEGADAKATLKTVPMQKGETALDTVSLWIATGAQLGELEDKKAARAAVLHTAAPPPQRVIQQARSQWIKIATLLVSNAEVSQAPAESVNAIVFPLTSAAQRAGARGARKAGGEPPAAPAAPDVPETPPK